MKRLEDSKGVSRGHSSEKGKQGRDREFLRKVERRDIYFLNEKNFV